MPVLRDYQCGECKKTFEVKTDVDDIVLCECGERAFRLPVGTKSYAIKGDNSASVTPKKHRAAPGAK